MTRLGSPIVSPFDIRLICATNLPIHQMLAERRFRQDLLYRIDAVELALPPLQERRANIPLLIEYLVEFYACKYNKPISGARGRGGKAGKISPSQQWARVAARHRARGDHK